MKEHYDVILVGAGLFNAVLATRLKELGKEILVIEKRNHIAGNCYTETRNNIDIHKYGAHIFRTSSDEIWNFVNKYSKFNGFINSPVANYKGELYNLPFNMNTFHQLYGVNTPAEAKAKIKEEVEKAGITTANNLEEHAISMVGKKMYEKLIKEYTEKQWQRPCTELPKEIIRRLPLRFTFDNNYFNARYQGIPLDGYTKMIEKMFEGCDIILNTDYLKEKDKWNEKADVVYYSGCIDEYYDYCLGELEYRSVTFKEEEYDTDNYQGVAVMNFTSLDVPYTRIIEHKHFNDRGSDTTIISKEYSSEWHKGDDPFYPINNEKNQSLYEQYEKLNSGKVKFVGRLGLYKYLDMEDTVRMAFALDIK